MKLIEEDTKKVINEIKKDFKEPLQQDILWSFLSKNSKQIRIILPILYFKALNKTIDENICVVLAVGEIIHNASLLHDDVIDNATERRGNTTISYIYSDKISILSGDYLLSLASQKILTLKNKEIMSLFIDCMKNMSLAEIKQYFLRNKIPALEEYIEICTNKTAILFETIFKSCAILYDMNNEKIFEFAKLFGIYFQLKNDSETKSAIADKKNGTRTLRDILDIENANCLLDNYKQRVMSFLSDIPNNIYKEKLEDIINNL